MERTDGFSFGAWEEEPSFSIEELSRKTISMKDVCSFLDISSETLRKYESYGNWRYLRAENGYRYFPFASLSQLYAFRSLVKCGITAKVAAGLASGSPAERLCAAMDDSIAANEREMALLELRNRAIGRQRDLISFIERLDGKVERVERPALWRLDCGVCASGLTSRRADDIVRSWTQYMPMVYLCPSMPLDETADSDTLVDVGVAIDEDIAEDLFLIEGIDLRKQMDADSGLKVEYFAARSCLATALRVDRSMAFENRRQGAGFYEAFEPVLRQVESHGHHVSGDILHRLVACNLDVNDGSGVDYYLAWFCID